MSLVKGKKGLIMGVANERSIAWGIAKKLSENGAELAFTYLGDALKKRVTPLAESVNSKFLLDCNVENKDDIKKTFEQIKKNGNKLILLFMQSHFQIEQNYQVSILTPQEKILQKVCWYHVFLLLK